MMASTETRPPCDVVGTRCRTHRCRASQCDEWMSAANDKNRLKREADLRRLGLPPTLVDSEPQPTDGPDYHAEHVAWVARQRKAEET